MGDYVTKTNVLSALARFKENTDALYETKADANEMKSELNQHDARLQNLEQKAGDYSIVQYRGTNAVPTGKAKYGLVKTIVGKTRAWNQLCKSVATTTSNGVTFTNNGDGSYTLNGTAGTGGAYILLFPDSDRISTHSYMAWDDNNSNSEYGFGLNRVRRTIYPAGYGFNAILFVGEGVTVSNIVVHPILRDLTAIFGLGNEPLTTADAIKAIPDIVKNEDFTGSFLANTTVTGVEAIGFNRWNEDFQTGYYYNTSTGSKQSSENWNCSRNKQGCVGGVDYYLSIKNKSTFLIHVLWFDANDNYITYEGRSSAGIVTAPSNASKFAMNIAIEEYGGTAYNHDICINKSQPNTSVNPHNGDYLPYQRTTLMLSSPFTGKSAGSVSEVLTLETGKKTRPIGSVDLGTLVWDYNRTNSYFYATLSDMKVIESGNVMPSFTCGRYEVISSRNNNAWASASDKSIGTRQTTSLVCVKDSAYSDAATFKSAMSGVYLNYELATPLSDEQVCDPIPDNTLYTEGGGTIETIQTQTPVIDNCLDVGYLAV